MIPHPELQQHLQAAVQQVLPQLQVQFRAMFGGASAYAYGQVFASLSDVGLALKLPPAAQAQLLQVEGAKRLQYEPSMPPSKQYIVVPPQLLITPQALGEWVAQSLEYVAQLPPKRRSV